MGPCQTVCYKDQQQPKSIVGAMQIIEEALDQQECEESHESLSQASVHSEKSVILEEEPCEDEVCIFKLIKREATTSQELIVEQTFPDGSYYTGEHINGKRNGFGFLKFNDGSFYEGQFRNDMIEGIGKYVWGTRSYYGSWMNNQMHGQGKTTWSDGRQYIGEYKFNQKDGYGEYHWYHLCNQRSDGRIYLGYWTDGLQNGEGEIRVNGKVKKGIWRMGQRLRWL